MTVLYAIGFLLILAAVAGVVLLTITRGLAYALMAVGCWLQSWGVAVRYQQRVNRELVETGKETLDVVLSEPEAARES